MDSVFSFDWHDNTNTSLFYRVIFLGPAIPNGGIIAEEIKRAVQRTLFPDQIILLCPAHIHKETCAALDSDLVQQERRRLGGRTGLTAHGYNAEGTIQSVKVLAGSQSQKLTKLQLHSIKSSGIKAVFDTPGVISPAPPGYAFLKPSGDLSTHFIRAEEALTESGKVEFIAFCLLRYINKIDSVDCIYVDSMGIASVAFSLREQLVAFGRRPPLISSFRSYEGFRKLSVLDPQNAFCLISASASMSMAKQWRDKLLCADHQVITLVTFEGVKSSFISLYAGKRPDSWRDLKPSEGRLKELRILGERFQAESIPVKTVTITKKNPPVEVKQLEFETRGHKVINCLRLSSDANFPIFLDMEELLKTENFYNWLETEVMANTPASVQAIVHLDDSSSLLMATRVLNILDDIGIKPKLGLLNESYCTQPDVTFDQNKALVLVGGVVGRGSSLLGLSRALRSIHKGPKLFLLGVQIAPSNQELDFLKSNLSQSQGGANRYCKYRAISIGDNLQESFADEARILKVLKGSFVGERLKALGYSTRGQDFPFLPDLNGNQLELRPDFVFWNSGYQSGTSNGPLVLLTIGALLQKLRESSEVSNDRKLATEALQQVVIDPRTFDRFNDGIIQASILRNAAASELDYSGSESCSRHMREILESVVNNRMKPQGEAALEFALAFATQKIRLRLSDQLKLKTWLKGIEFKGPLGRLLQQFLFLPLKRRTVINPSHF
jgi:hypothetical protein